MGKKDPNNLVKKRKLQQATDVDASDESDAELEAELQALAAIRAEREEVENDDEEEESNNGGGNEKAPKRVRGIYNKDGLEYALANCTELSFLESYAICEFDLEPTDENDDLAREMAFYKQSLQAVHVGRDRLKQLGVPVRRPDDYFAESVKSDAHMQRVKDKLLLETKKMDAFEKRRQRETNRKYNKQLQDLRKKEIKTKTKDATDAFTNLRKSGAKGEKLDEKVEQLLHGRGGKPGRGEGDRERTEKSSKRKNMDKKYGAGIKEKMRNKLNDKKSFNDMSTYNPRGGKQVRREKPGGKGGAGGKGKVVKSSNRPGKERRSAKRSGTGKK
jgi:rRNA-processing protein EBP2